MKIEGHGITLELPDGWSGRIFTADTAGAIVHAGSYAIPSDHQGFGGTATAYIPVGGAFLSIVEYRTDDGVLRAGEGYYRSALLPVLSPRDFGFFTLQVPRDGHLGVQRFFHHGERVLALYAVINAAGAALSELAAPVAALNRVLGSLVVQPQARTWPAVAAG